MGMFDTALGKYEQTAHGWVLEISELMGQLDLRSPP